jgi:hypothetical protein
MIRRMRLKWNTRRGREAREHEHICWPRIPLRSWRAAAILCDMTVRVDVIQDHEPDDNGRLAEIYSPGLRWLAVLLRPQYIHKCSFLYTAMKGSQRFAKSYMEPKALYRYVCLVSTRDHRHSCN